MRKLIVKNVGPITQTATIEFKRFCILIGPQSNGKSTIAKILSTCLWLEKEACTSLNDTIINDGDEFVSQVEDFHRMHNYIHRDSSYIEYQSPYITIIYDKGQFSMTFKDNLSYNRLKISYMPSDRNIVTMKDIEKRDMEPTNFRSFLFDWLDTNRNFDSQHKAPILNLDVKYYFDDKAKDRMDMLTHVNGVTYDIPLYDASSGMQSLVPMTVLMHYLTTDYFDNYGKDTSFDQQQKQNERAWAITREITTKYYPEEVKKNNYKDVYNQLIKNKSIEHDQIATAYIDEMKDLFARFTIPQSISFILEEPEQNLFPKTQVDLFNDIISCCTAEHPSSAFITTHSPYLLAAVNIMLFKGKLKKQGLAPQHLQEITGTDTFIDDSDFTAYTVSGGTCYSIIDDKTHLIKENELDSASDYNAEVFDSLYKIYVKRLQSK